jgi:hypothetical protein
MVADIHRSKCFRFGQLALANIKAEDGVITQRPKYLNADVKITKLVN